MKTANKLSAFRRRCERQTGQTIGEVEVPLLFVLHDLCQLLGLPQASQAKVLGRKGMKCLRQFQESTPSTRVKPQANNHHTPR